MNTKVSNYEASILKAYLQLPARKLLNHRFEAEEDYLAGYVTRFLNGERFEIKFIAFTKEQMEIINPIISKNIDTMDGKDLLTATLMTKTVCNIMNKYRKE